MARAVLIVVLLMMVPVMFLAAAGAAESDEAGAAGTEDAAGTEGASGAAIADEGEAETAEAGEDAEDTANADRESGSESEDEALTLEEEALRVYKISNMVAGTIFNVAGIVFVVESGSRYTTEVEPAWMRYNERTSGTADEFASAYDEYTDEYNTYLLHMFTGVGLGTLGVIFTLIGMLATEPPPGYAGEPEAPVDVSVNDQGLMIRVRY